MTMKMNGHAHNGDEHPPPVEVEIPPFHRAVFDFKRFQKATKHWDITLKLVDTLDGSVVAAKPNTWPYEEPPISIRFDGERKVLSWENAESNACIPLRIPANRVVNRLSDAAQPTAPRANPKLLFRAGFSAGKATRGATKGKNEAEPKDAQWKELINGTIKCSPEFDFNPLFEERLPLDEQVRVLEQMAARYDAAEMPQMLLRMIRTRFFELAAINSFVTNKAVESTTVLKSPPSSSKSKQTAVDQLPPIVLDLLREPSVVLFAPAYAALLRRCAAREARGLRAALLQKSFPSADLTARLIADFDLETSLSVFEAIFEDFVVFEADSKLIEKAFDLLALIADTLAEKIAWATDKIYAKRLAACRKSLNLLLNLSKCTQKVVEQNALNRRFPHSGTQSSDYAVYYKKIHRVEL